MAQTQNYTRKAQIHIVEESSQDTYSGPGGSGTNIILGTVSDTPMTLNSENYVPAYSRADFLSMDEVPGSCWASLNFQLPLKYSGTAGTAPEIDEFLKACGLKVTNTPGTSDVYTPLSTFDGAGGNPGPSYSCTILEDGVAWAIKGAFGTFSFTATPGEPVMLDCVMTGAYVAVADDGLEAPTYQTTVPPAFLGASCTIGGATPKGVSSFSFDLGNNVVAMPDANEATGYYGARITSRKSTGSLEFESELVATRDDYGLWRAGTVAAITTGTVGSTAGNRWALSLARCTRRPPEQVNSDGVRKLSVPYGVGSANTDVEGTNADVTLTFN